LTSPTAAPPNDLEDYLAGVSLNQRVPCPHDGCPFASHKKYNMKRHLMISTLFSTLFSPRFPGTHSQPRRRGETPPQRSLLLPNVTLTSALSHPRRPTQSRMFMSQIPHGVWSLRSLTPSNKKRRLAALASRVSKTLPFVETCRGRGEVLVKQTQKFIITNSKPP